MADYSVVVERKTLPPLVAVTTDTLDQAAKYFQKLCDTARPGESVRLLLGSTEVSTYIEPAM